MVLIFISLMINYFEKHFYVYNLSIQITCPFLNRVICLFLVELYEFFMYFRHNFFKTYVFEDISSYFVGFSLLMLPCPLKHKEFNSA